MNDPMNQGETASTNQFNHSTRVVPPGSSIGILGGGQLGRMMALDGRKMGYRFITLDPTPDSPAGQVCDKQIVASFSDLSGARELAQFSDVITYEFENVDAAVAAVLEAESDVPQGSRLLFTTQHRLREKRAIQDAGASVAPYVAVSTEHELLRGLSQIGFPAVLKTSMGGYDGKGQWLLASEEDARRAWQEWFSRNHATLPGRAASTQDPSADSLEAPLILEQYVPFTKELSVVIARSRNGETVCFPVAENIHEHHILHLSIVPARVDNVIQQNAVAMAKRVAQGLGVVGLLAVELFLTEDGSLYVNELAPRPHNSGHYTMDACVTSQFEQHVRAICGLPLGSPALLSPVVMVNVLGQHVNPLLAKLPDLPNTVKLHMYGKAEAKRDRKMGHLNVLGEQVDVCLQTISDIGMW